ncbi:MAG: hypothetical protein OIN87_08790, partial [Candidatus Methanoperedens sp.]|nr:hypothetical protein [Candidatus Methanoperedens sp.]
MNKFKKKGARKTKRPARAKKPVDIDSEIVPTNMLPEGITDIPEGEESLLKETTEETSGNIFEESADSLEETPTESLNEETTEAIFEESADS